MRCPSKFGYNRNERGPIAAKLIQSPGDVGGHAFAIEVEQSVGWLTWPIAKIFVGASDDTGYRRAIEFTLGDNFYGFRKVRSQLAESECLVGLQVLDQRR